MLPSLLITACLASPVSLAQPLPPVTPAVIALPFKGAAANWLPAHRGVDLVAAAGQSITAPVKGRIVFADRVAGRAVVVLRTHAARFTFEPVAAAPPVGTRVRTGAPIGRLAQGGHCDGRCLHWGAKVDGQYVDPMSFLRRSQPVLKPVWSSRR